MSGHRGEPLDEAQLGRALERLRAVLRQRDLKFSKVRAAIVRAVLAHEGHFGAEELVRVLRAAGVRDAHLATVYRNLPLLVDAGIIHPALIAQGQGQRYEVAFEREHHDHLVCTRCGLVVEYQSEAMEALQREIAARYGFVLDDHVHELRGRCESCRRVGAGRATVAPRGATA